MNKQYDLYGGIPPHSDEETSLDAALEVIPTVASMRTKVLLFIRNSGVYGATDWEIENGLQMLANTVRPRRRELVLTNLITDSGRRRPTQTGRLAKVWVELG